MNRLLVAGLLPGATVTLRRGGSTLGTTVASGTSVWLDVDPGATCASRAPPSEEPVPPSWTPSTAGSAASGTVPGGVADTETAFSIALGQVVPPNLTLVSGPVGRARPGRPVGRHLDREPDWGAPAVTVIGNRPTAMLPPPPDATGRVSVSLSPTAHLAGLIEGIGWPQRDIPIGGRMGWVALTKATHALSAQFTYGIRSVPIVDESGNVTGWEEEVLAQVTLLGVS